MLVPHRELSEAALAGVVEEYVTRDGTELTDAASKTKEVLLRLDRGELVLVYDVETGSCNIVPSDEIEQERGGRNVPVSGTAGGGLDSGDGDEREGGRFPGR